MRQRARELERYTSAPNKDQSLSHGYFPRPTATSSPMAIQGGSPLRAEYSSWTVSLLSMSPP